MHVTIYTDGASRGNPGPGGYGAVLMAQGSDGKVHTKELSQGYKSTTNNRMELLGPIRAFEELRYPCDVDLYSDSQYLIKAFNDHWIDGWIKKGWVNSQRKPVKNDDLWKALLAVSRQHNVTYHWVKGHVGNEYNERCDELATTAADGTDLIDDEILTGY